MSFMALKKIFEVEPYDSGNGLPGETVLTRLNITEAPTSVEKGKTFRIKGKLETELGGPVKAATIKHAYNGTPLGTSTTDNLGIFQKYMTIPEAGTFYVSARFSAIPGKFGPSSNGKYIKVTEIAPPPPGEGNANIIEIDLPDTLNPRDEINGLIRVKNLGDKDTIRLRITREWLGKTTNHSVDLKKDYVLRVTVTHTMPEENAKYTFKAQHRELLTYVTDDIATYTITLKEAPPEEPPPEEPPDEDEEPPEEEKTFWEELTEAWNALEGWQKALIAGTTVGAAIILVRPRYPRYPYPPPPAAYYPPPPPTPPTTLK